LEPPWPVFSNDRSKPSVPALRPEIEAVTRKPCV